MTEFQARLKKCREHCGLSYHSLQRLSDVSVGYLHTVETENVGKPSDKIIRKIADALGVSFEYLKDGEVIIRSYEIDSLLTRFRRLDKSDKDKFLQLVKLWSKEDK